MYILLYDPKRVLLLMVNFRARTIKFLYIPEIRKLVEDNDLDAIYNAYIERYYGSSDLTLHLEECNVDPLEYVSRIHESMYADRKDLTTFIIPNGFISIDKGAFLECTNLQEIRIPKSIKQIDYDAFLECINLKNVQYEGTMLEWRKIRKTAAFDNTDITFIHCSDGIIYPEEL